MTNGGRDDVAPERAKDHAVLQRRQPHPARHALRRVEQLLRGRSRTTDRAQQADSTHVADDLVRAKLLQRRCRYTPFSATRSTRRSSSRICRFRGRRRRRWVTAIREPVDGFQTSWTAWVNMTPERKVAARHALGEDHQVRVDVPVLHPEPQASAPEPVITSSAINSNPCLSHSARSSGKYRRAARSRHLRPAPVPRSPPHRLRPHQARPVPAPGRWRRPSLPRMPIVGSRGVKSLAPGLSPPELAIPVAGRTVGETVVVANPRDDVDATGLPRGFQYSGRSYAVSLPPPPDAKYVTSRSLGASLRAWPRARSRVRC